MDIRRISNMALLQYAGADERYVPLEYLESTGGQYIDTGVYVNQTTDVAIDYAYVRTSNQFSMFGCNPLIAFTAQANVAGAAIRYNNSIVATSVPVVERAVRRLEGNKVYVNGALEHTFTAATFQANRTALLFARSVNDANTIQEKAEARIWQCTIYDNGVLVRDLVPMLRLRDGKPGMYDRVGDKFYTNIGTGEFLHPEPATASSYIQDGLVAMWDGIENAGWGRHKDNATVWKDLKRPAASSAWAASAWTDNALSLSSAVYLPPDYFSDARPTNYTFEYCIEIPLVEQRAGSTMFCWRNALQGPFILSTAWNYLRFTGGGTGTYGNDVTSYSIADHIGTSFKATMTELFTQNVLYVDGAKARDNFPQEVSASLAHRPMLDTGGQAAVYWHSLRIYNRSLTPEEIAHNYAVDRLRFNLA